MGLGVLDHPRLSRRARAALNAVPPEEPVGVAAISLKEASWHLARGQIVVDAKYGPWPLWLRAAASSPRVQLLPLTVEVAIESEHLGERFSPDPADRLIVATARVHGPDAHHLRSTHPQERRSQNALVNG